MKIYKALYYSLAEMYGNLCNESNTLPYTNKNLKEISDIIFDNAPTYPITLNSDHVVKLWKEIYARFYDEPIFKIDWLLNVNPEFSDIQEEALDFFQKWFLRVVSVISRTEPYYKSLLDAYASAQTHLMDDITATSKNTIKYNETPQNYDSGGTYEGDNHLTNFTKTEGENTSPLTSKIMRLKEIQDHYKRVLDDWVNEFQILFYEGGDC